MRIAVCDDCMEDARSVRKFLGGHDVTLYYDADSFRADIEERNIRYDLYMLDIYIDETINGIGLAKIIRKKHEEAVVCFVSSGDGFYREAYDLYAVQYLLKPVQEHAVEQLLERVEKSIGAGREQKLSFQFRGRVESIPYGRILYISSREHMLAVSCTDGTVHECRGRLNELAAQICGDVFIRCHQSYIVNIYHVDNFGGDGLTVGGRHIPVSRRYYAEVKKKYRDVLFEEVD